MHMGTFCVLGNWINKKETQQQQTIYVGMLKILIWCKSRYSINTNVKIVDWKNVKLQNEKLKEF